MCMLANSYTDQKSDGGFSLLRKFNSKQFNTGMTNIQSSHGQL